MRRFLGLAFFTAVIGICAACSADMAIGYCCNNFNDTFQTYIVDAAKEAAKEAGVSIDVLDAQEDVIRQQDQVNILLESGVDALIVVPVNTSAVAPIIAAARQSGVPLIFVNRNPFAEGQTEDGVYFIGADPVMEGRTQMEYAGELLEGKGNICILMGMLSNEGAISRTSGIIAVVQENFPGITVLAEETANWQRDQGVNVTENWLTAYDDQINAILANNDEMALGAVMALSNAGVKGIHVLGTDATPDARQAIKDGRMAATVLQDPISQGRGSVEMAIKIVKGEQTEQMIMLLPQLITIDNSDG